MVRSMSGPISRITTPPDNAFAILTSHAMQPDACSSPPRCETPLRPPRFPILTLDEAKLIPSLGYLFDRKSVEATERRRYSEVFSYCRSCMARGYHSILHQTGSAARCPAHRCLMEWACRRCGYEAPYRVNVQLFEARIPLRALSHLLWRAGVATRPDSAHAAGAPQSAGAVVFGASLGVLKHWVEVPWTPVALCKPWLQYKPPHGTEEQRVTSGEMAQSAGSEPISEERSGERCCASSRTAE